ncbi:MAG: prefoldin subunit beta [Candidatus Thorarchaeota archaeon]|nr:prefoldin subunit beta [Candidatus Thorarchaeota archaeon]
MAQKIPPALEAELQKFDTMRRNHETLTTMSQALQTELTEVKGTLDELVKQPDDVVVYKSVGQVMFKAEKPALVEELDDRQKTLEMRLASTKKQLESLTEKLQELQNKIQIELSKQNLRLQ